MTEITSASNEKLKYAKKIMKSSSFRREKGELFLEGARLCRDAVQSNIEITDFFFTEKSTEKYGEYIDEIKAKANGSYVISSELATKLSDTESTQGVFAIGKIPVNFVELNGKMKYLALENIQDPSNLGAIIRTAEAIGIDGIIICSGCDLYNPKALRASMGSSFRVKILQCKNLPELIIQANKMGMNTYAAVPSAQAEDIRTLDFNKGAICCIGNEGNGLTEQTISACAVKATIPMRGRAESFNACVAASIIAWEMMR